MMALNQTLSAVVFDLDGVIVDTADLHFLAWRHIAIELGIPFDEAENEALKGVGRMESLELLLGPRAQSFTVDEKLALAAQKNAVYVDSLASVGPSHCLPGAVDAIAQVRDAGLRVALASSSRNAPMILEKLALAEWFDVVADPSAVLRGKPAPDIFLQAAELLEVAPVSCLGIEDSVAGIAGLKAAGMVAVGVGTPEVLIQSDVVLSTLCEFHIAKFGPSR